MATTDHPLVLDLGKVTGLSVYEEWLLQDGNAGKTFQEFLREIAQLGIDVAITESVEADNPAVVTSRGVWNKLAELGLLDVDGQKPWQRIPGSAAISVHEYSLGDAIAPGDDAPDAEDVSAWIDAAAGANGVWTLSPEPGQEWHVDNNATAARALKIDLPDLATLGTRIRVVFAANGAATTCAIPTIVTGGVLLLGETPPESIKAAEIDFTMGKNGWVAVRHFLSASDDSVASNTAKIVYSGANRKATESTSYTTTVSWTGTGTKSATLRKDVFRSLCGTAPFKGWTTSKTGTTVTHADGATVTLSPGQTLTLYPLYTETAKTINLGQTSDGTFSATGTGTLINKTISLGSFSFNPATYISGFKGDSYRLELVGYLKAVNNHASTLSYKIGSGAWTQLCSAVNQSSETKTATVTLSGTGAQTIAWQGTQTAKTTTASSKWRGYVARVFVS